MKLTLILILMLIFAAPTFADSIQVVDGFLWGSQVNGFDSSALLKLANGSQYRMDTPFPWVNPYDLRTPTTTMVFNYTGTGEHWVGQFNVQHQTFDYDQALGGPTHIAIPFTMVGVITNPDKSALDVWGQGAIEITFSPDESNTNPYRYALVKYAFSAAEEVVDVPEPSSWLQLLCGLLMLMVLRKRIGLAQSYPNGYRIRYSVNSDALGPVNEQLHSTSDPWLLWVKEQADKMKRSTVRWSAIFLLGLCVNVSAEAAQQAKDCGDAMRQTTRPAGFAGTALAVDPSGNIFLAEIGQTTVRRISTDGQRTTAAETTAPITSIAVDGTGNLFIAETRSPRIRKITPAGVRSIVAGSGEMKNDGDGGPAVSASICAPINLATDRLGDLFIASGPGPQTDSFARGDYRIRKVAADGVITSVAGNGIPPKGMGSGGPAPESGKAATSGAIWPSQMAAGNAGELYFGSGSQVWQVAPSGIITLIAGVGGGRFSGDGGPATAAQVSPASGLVVDRAGNIFIGESVRIRKIDPAGIITTFAGTGTRGSTGDGGPAAAAQIDMMGDRGGGGPAMAVDGSGNLFFVERDNRIRKITPEGVISTVVTP